MKELWVKYLEIINFMSENPGTYGMDDQRAGLHKELFNKYQERYPNIIKERFDDICHNLDKIIDFNPPLLRCESIKVYARDIDSYFYRYGKIYITNPKITRKYKTKRGL